MRLNILNILVTYLRSLPIGTYLVRSDVVHKVGTQQSGNYFSVVGDYLYHLNRAGYLTKVDNEMVTYLLDKHPAEDLTVTKLKEEGILKKYKNEEHS